MGISYVAGGHHILGTPYAVHTHVGDSPLYLWELLRTSLMFPVGIAMGLWVRASIAAYCTLQFALQIPCARPVACSESGTSLGTPPFTKDPRMSSISLGVHIPLCV